MIIFQRNRILVSEIQEDLKSEFIKNNTVFQKAMTFGYEEKWTAIAEVMYKDQPYIALPRNFPLKYLNKYLTDNERLKDDYHIPYKKVPIKNSFQPRDDVQVELLDFLIGRNQYKEINGKPRRALFADTGIGKTYLTLKFLCGFNYMGCIFCPDERALKTWKEEIAKFTNIEEHEIAIAQGRESLPKILKNKDKYKILLFSNKTASSMYDSNNVDEVISFFEQMEIAVKIFDEMHLHLRTIFFTDMYIVTFRTVYLTATNEMRIFGEQKVLNHMTPMEDCVYKQEDVPKFDFYKVVYYTNPPRMDKKGIEKIGGFDALQYLKFLLCERPKRTEFFWNMVLHPTFKKARKMLTDPVNHKIAFIAKTNEAGRWIGNKIEQNYPELSIGYFNSDIKKMELRELELDRQVIITTDKSFAGILNIYNLSVEIIATPITAPAHIKQIMGRLREEGNKRRIVFQLADCSFKSVKGMIYREVKLLEPICLSMNTIKVNEPEKEEVNED
jgi:hypothetical protein